MKPLFQRRHSPPLWRTLPPAKSTPFLDLIVTPVVKLFRKKKISPVPSPRVVLPDHDFREKPLYTASTNPCALYCLTRLEKRTKLQEFYRLNSRPAPLTGARLLVSLHARCFLPGRWAAGIRFRGFRHRFKLALEQINGRHRGSLNGGASHSSDPIASGMQQMSSTMFRDPAHQTHSTMLQDNIDELKEIAPYCFSKVMSDMLNARGIPASTTPSGIHAHPAHKAIENWILKRVLPANFKSDFTVWWMKEAKFNALKKQNKHAVELGNERLSNRDFVRYAGTPPIKPIRTKGLFVHDALHFLSPSWVASVFEKNPELDEMHATAILPAEVLEREQSFYPNLYALTYNEDSFSYHLEGNMADRYEQPYNDWFLRHDKLLCPKFTITVERVDNWFGHHYFIIRRGSHTVPKHLGVDLPNAVLLPVVGDTSRTRRQRMVPHVIYQKTLGHGRHLKAPRNNDSIAKIRSYQGSEEHCWTDESAWEYLSQFVYGIIPLTTPDLHVGEELRFPDWICRLRRAWRNRSWLPSTALAVGQAAYIGVSAATVASLGLFAGASTVFIASTLAWLYVPSLFALGVAALVCPWQWRTPMALDAQRLKLVYLPSL